VVQSEAHKGNIGEWSELYTLAYLLAYGGAYAADENQNAIPSIFHKVLQVHIFYKDDSKYLNYTINNIDVEICLGENKIANISRSSIKTLLDSMFNELTNGKHRRTFELTTGNNLLTLLSKNKVSAGSSQFENDLELVLEDLESKVPTPKVGFNIKSQLGGRSTLLNASGATNFIYEVMPNNSNGSKNFPIFEHGKHKKNLNSLYQSDYHLEFRSLASTQFYNNLTLLDMKFPEYLAEVLLHSYLTGNDSFEGVVENVFSESNPLSRQPVFKLKEFLGAIAMGLRPTNLWDGDTTRFSGILVVKMNGEVVFYYLYNRKSFESHLFSNVYFERPSTSRHKYGEIYQSNGKFYIKLNLQIRFNK
jgi:hypothetical protein